jgi:hypothetical protein
MTMESPWALLLLVLPALWTILNWRRGRHQGRLVATSVSAGVLVLALSQPKLALRESRMAVAVLKDSSAGIGNPDLRREAEFVAGLEKARGKHVVRVIPFGETRYAPERTEPWVLAPTPGPAGRDTDIETAVREGIATLPAGRVPRLVILSDGREDFRGAERAVLEAQQLGIPIDTIPLAGQPPPEPRQSQPVTVPQPRALLVSGESRGNSAVQRHCLVVVLEKSARMDGAKLELAKLAAVGLIENLRRTDLVGVLAFDNGYRWLATMGNAGERDPIGHSIDNLTAGGGVQIAAALREALRRLQPVHAGFKHIVLLTDGVSQDAGALPLARKAAAQDVTVSTISIGEDQTRRYLSRLAGFSRGASLFLRDPSGLEQVAAIQIGRPLLARRQDPQARAVAYVGYSQEPLLRWISESTGGRFNPSPSGIFDPDGRTVVVFLPLWPALVLLALGWTLFGMIPQQDGRSLGQRVFQHL